jgi:F-type H+-transporting ATPase subunit delta
MAKLVSKTYGDALFELAVENGQLKEIMSEVLEIKKILDENGEFSKLMNHPKIVNEEKVKLLEDVFVGRISKEVLGLMRMLITKGHYNEMESVFAYFVDQAKEHNNIGTAFVTAARPLSDKQKAQITAKLLATTKYVEFDIHYALDRDLIGGMVIRIGDRVVDSSIKTKLAKLSGELSKIQLKVGESTP